VTIQGTLGFLGYGNMGSAILEGLIHQGTLSGKHALVFDPVAARCDAAEAIGAGVAATLEALVSQSDLLMLAVKPQMMEEVFSEVKPHLQEKTLVVSIAAGTSIKTIQDGLGGGGVRVIRVMPNTPALAQAGAAGIAPSGNCTEKDIETAKTIFEAVGIAEIVSEEDIDAVTALSGSGPAYFFAFVEALIKGATAEGLDAGVARRLAAQTLYGAGCLLHASGEAPEDLRRKVTSPGGTTEAALNQFQADGLDSVVASAVHAAVERGRELGA
jgi:pyrroline-5-carboxylate reductase